MENTALNRMKNAQGFTLVELIVVLVILGILLAIVVPTSVAYIGKADKTSAMVECRYVVQAARATYIEEYAKGRLYTSTAPGGDLLKAILLLSEVPGTIQSIQAEGENQIVHLEYISGSGYLVTYCAQAPDCHEQMYTFEGGAGGGGEGQNSPGKFYVTGVNGERIEFTPYANFSTYIPERYESLAGTVFYYEGSEEYGYEAGYYTFDGTCPVSPTKYGDAQFHQLWEWNNAIKINVDTPIKEYKTMDKEFIGSLYRGDICQIDFGDGPVLAVYTGGSRTTTNVGSWMWNRDLASPEFRGHWTVVETESIAPTRKS